MSLTLHITKTIVIALIKILIRPIYLNSVYILIIIIVNQIRLGIRLGIGLGIGFFLVYTHFLVYKCL